jgi:hypothetical protein
MSGYLIEPNLFTSSDLYAPPQHVDPSPPGVVGLRGHPHSSQRVFYARSCN